MAFVLNTCCQSKICPIVGVFGGTISLNRVFGAAWISNNFYIELFFTPDIDTEAIYQNMHTRSVGP